MAVCLAQCVRTSESDGFPGIRQIITAYPAGARSASFTVQAQVGAATHCHAQAGLCPVSKGGRFGSATIILVLQEVIDPRVRYTSITA